MLLHFKIQIIFCGIPFFEKLEFYNYVLSS